MGLGFGQPVIQCTRFDYSSEALQERDSVLWLAVKAYEHMRSLVIKNNKDSAKGKLRWEDEQAAIHINSDKAGDVCACVLVNDEAEYATNSSGGSGSGHAEMRLFQKHGFQVQYIGVSRLCCLYCAAQLLACGFHGFRGCHMNSFKGYTWLPAIDNSNFRTALWGAQVEYYLKKLDENGWQQFLSKISNGDNVLSKFLQYYNDEYQPMYEKSETNPFSGSNQKNYFF
jgi:hypothetical protein